MKRNRILTVIILLAMMTALLSGCGTVAGESSVKEPGTNAAETSAQSTAAQEPETDAPATEPVIRPSDTIMSLSEYGDELSVWIATLMSIENNTDSINDMTAVQEYEKKTGVHINWEQATSAGAVEQFNVMCSSGEYPDIILGFDNYATGGATGGYENEIIIKLNDYIEEYMPNYCAQLNADENLKRNAITDSGDYLGVYGFYETDYYPLSGPMIRQDWLDALELEVPTTYEEYANVAKAFKAEYGCSDPILMLGDITFFSGMGYTVGYFSGSYGTPGFSFAGTGKAALGIYQENGTAKAAIIEDGYKDYLMMLNAWYNDGIISKDFATNPVNQMTPDYSSFIFNSQTGIFVGDAVNMMGYAGAAVDESFALVGAPDPVQNEDDDPNSFGISRERQQGNSAAVSTTCENVELALRWMDQWFTEEGSVLSNYGVEDLSYTVNADGDKVYTDLVLHNETLNQQAATIIYTVSFVPTINTQQNRFVLWKDTPVVTDAVNLWYNSTTCQGNMPKVSLNTEESATYSDLAATIQTYAAENIARFVNGEKSFDEWDAFVQQVKELGVDDCIAAYQSALDRFNQR